MNHYNHNYRGRPTWQGGARVPPSVRYGHRWKSLPLEAERPRRPWPVLVEQALVIAALFGGAYIILRVAASFLGK